MVAAMAWECNDKDDLVAIDAHGLFPRSTTWIGFRRDRFLRDYMYGFLEMMVPGMDRKRIDEFIANADGGTGPAYGDSLGALNQHPSIGNRFSSCCNGTFNL